MDLERYADVLAKIAQTLITEYGISDVLYELCDDLVALAGVRGVGVMLAGDDDVMRFAAASDESVAIIERLQQEHGEGPCLDAYRTGREVTLADISADEGSPKFAGAALEEGMRSVQAFPMQVHGRLVGALSLYSDDVTTLDFHALDAARTLAACATSYILNCRALDEAVELATQLQQALDSRVVIEQAKGKVAQKLGVTVSDAFERVRKHARDRGLRLREVAQAIVDGELSLE